MLKKIGVILIVLLILLSAVLNLKTFLDNQINKYEQIGSQLTIKAFIDALNKSGSVDIQTDKGTITAIKKQLPTSGEVMIPQVAK